MYGTFALPGTSIAHMLKQKALRGSVSSRAKTTSRGNPPERSHLPPALLLKSYWVRKSGEQLGHRCGEDVGGALAPCGGAVPAEKDFQTPSCDRHTAHVRVPGAAAARHAPFYTTIKTSGAQQRCEQRQQKPFLSFINAPWKHNSQIWTNPPKARRSSNRRPGCQGNAKRGMTNCSAAPRRPDGERTQVPFGVSTISQMLM